MPSRRIFNVIVLVLMTIAASSVIAVEGFDPQYEPRLEKPRLSSGIRVDDLFDDSAVSEAAGRGFRPQFEPQVEIAKISGGIRVDGQLGDPGWRQAAVIGNFAETTPGDQVEPAVKTTARIAYDENNLYVSCVCYDNPEEIRATYCDRDQLTGNDVIVLLIDTYGEAAWAYNLYVNPLGVQTDAMWRPLGSDFGYNVVYESAGQITDSGYQVEIAVPFSSLHFPSSEEQSWRFNINRIRPRESWFEYHWAAYDRSNPCVPCQWGEITGLKNIKPAKGLEIIPSALGYQTGEACGSLTPDDPYDFHNYDADGEMAINAKYKPVSNISLEATINPDFSQIEPDAAQVDVNTSSVLAFPERRPFFQEARQLFYTWRAAYYSRMINDPKVAFKASGKIGKTSFGYLSAYDEHSPFILPFEDASVYILGKESYSNVLRWLHTVGEDSYIGLLATDRRFEGGGSGTMINFDGQWRMHENYRLQVQAMASHIKEPDDPMLNEQISPYIERGWVDSTFGDEGYTALFDGESFNGYYWIINLEERARHLNFDIGYLEAGPTYRSDLGFQRDGNWRSVEAFGCYIMYFDNGWLEKLEPNLSITNRWNFDGQKKYRGGELGVIAKLRGQLTLSVDYAARSENFRGLEFDDLWSVYGKASKSFSEQLFVSVSGDYGRQISRSYLVTGKQTSLNLYAYIRPSDRLQIEPDYDYIKSVNTDDNSVLYEGYIFRTKAYYYFSRKFNIRLVAQYNDIYETLNIDPLVTYRINPFTVFYLGTSYEYCEMTGTENGFEQDNVYLNQRQFFVKLQYLFQI